MPRRGLPGAREQRKREKLFAAEREVIRRRKEVAEDQEPQPTVPPVASGSGPTPTRRQETRPCIACRETKPWYEYMEGSLTCRGCNRHHPSDFGSVDVGGLRLQ